MLKKIWQWIKTHFLTRKFITFGIIGVMNTAISLAVYKLFYDVYLAGPFWSNTAGFITASIFSYFANALFTFKPKNRNAMQFSVVMGVFLVRLLTSNGLTTLFDYIMLHGFHADYTANSYLNLVAPFFASALLIPIAYFALDFVFRKTDYKKQGK